MAKEKQRHPLLSFSFFFCSPCNIYFEHPLRTETRCSSQSFAFAAIQCSPCHPCRTHHTHGTSFGAYQLASFSFNVIAMTFHLRPTRESSDSGTPNQFSFLASHNLPRITLSFTWHMHVSALLLPGELHVPGESKHLCTWLVVNVLLSQPCEIHLYPISNFRPPADRKGIFGPQHYSWETKKVVY